MNQVEKLDHIAKGWGVGRICLNCKHVQQSRPMYPGTGSTKQGGLPFTSVTSGRLGWKCQCCKFLHEEPKY